MELVEDTGGIILVGMRPDMEFLAQPLARLTVGPNQEIVLKMMIQSVHYVNIFILQKGACLKVKAGIPHLIHIKTNVRINLEEVMIAMLHGTIIQDFVPVIIKLGIIKFSKTLLSYLLRKESCPDGSVFALNGLEVTPSMIIFRYML